MAPNIRSVNRMRLIALIFWVASSLVFAREGTIRAIDSAVNKAYSVVESCPHPCSMSFHEKLFRFRIADAVWAHHNNQLSSQCLAEIKKLPRGDELMPRQTSENSSTGCHLNEIRSFISWTQNNEMCAPTSSPLQVIPSVRERVSP